MPSHEPQLGSMAEGDIAAKPVGGIRERAGPSP
jgi:hypothetical protein